MFEGGSYVYGLFSADILRSLAGSSFGIGVSDMEALLGTD